MIKKTILVAVLAVFIFQTAALAQKKFEVTPFYGFMFAGKATGYNGDLNFRDDQMYGLILDITLKPGIQLELYYSRSDTRVDFVEFRGPTYKLTDASINYIQIGALRNLKKMGKTTIFGVGSLGATLLSPTGESYNETPEAFTYEDWWLFSLTMGGGAKIQFSERIGLRLEGRLMMPITWSGGGFMVGSGGSGFYLGGGSAILQASLTAGIIIALGN